MEQFDSTTLYAGATLVSCCSLIFMLLVIAGLWKVYVKAGKPGWAAIIPIYNIWVLLQIVGRPAWWIILFFIPFVNVIMSIVIAFDVAESFEHGIPFALGLVFFPYVFFLMLGFGDSKYAGPAAAPKMTRDWRS